MVVYSRRYDDSIHYRMMVLSPSSGKYSKVVTLFLDHPRNFLGTVSLTCITIHGTIHPICLWLSPFFPWVPWATKVGWARHDSLCSFSEHHTPRSFFPLSGFSYQKNRYYFYCVNLADYMESWTTLLISWSDQAHHVPESIWGSARISHAKTSSMKSTCLSLGDVPCL